MKTSYKSYIFIWFIFFVMPLIPEDSTKTIDFSILALSYNLLVSILAIITFILFINLLGKAISDNLKEIKKNSD